MTTCGPKIRREQPSTNAGQYRGGPIMSRRHVACAYGGTTRKVGVNTQQVEKHGATLLYYPPPLTPVAPPILGFLYVRIVGGVQELKYMPPLVPEVFELVRGQSSICVNYTSATRRDDHRTSCPCNPPKSVRSLSPLEEGKVSDEVVCFRCVTNSPRRRWV